jgi:hypothetical protein
MIIANSSDGTIGVRYGSRAVVETRPAEFTDTSARQADVANCVHAMWACPLLHPNNPTAMRSRTDR